MDTKSAMEIDTVDDDIGYLEVKKEENGTDSYKQNSQSVNCVEAELIRGVSSDGSTYSHSNESTIRMERDISENIKKEESVCISDVGDEDQMNIDKTVENLENSTSETNATESKNILCDEVIIKPEEDLLKLNDEVNMELNDENLFCIECGDEYGGYCSSCPVLCTILNQNVPKTDSNWSTKTIPERMLQFGNKGNDLAVFASRIIPKDVIFGPFEGLDVEESKMGGVWSVWTIKDNKLYSSNNRNWMQYINGTRCDLSYNLIAFQYNNKLFYKSHRDILESEELIVYYDKKHLRNSYADSVKFLIPTVKNDFPVVYACTFCCMGFNAEKYLIHHKRQCPYLDENIVEGV